MNSPAGELELELLCTIGYTKKSLKEFVNRLREVGVDCVVDVRLRNTSQLAGFAKRDDLEFLLTEGFGIEYVHMPELAPSDEILDTYKSAKDWDGYVPAFSSLILERDMVPRFLARARASGWKRPCLLCAEDEPDHCHRRLLAEAIAGEHELEVKHL